MSLLKNLTSGHKREEGRGGVGADFCIRGMSPPLLLLLLFSSSSSSFSSSSSSSSSSSFSSSFSFVFFTHSKACSNSEGEKTILLQGFFFSSVIGGFDKGGKRTFLRVVCAVIHRGKEEDILDKESCEREEKPSEKNRT